MFMFLHTLGNNRFMNQREMSDAPVAPGKVGRIVSIDQFRGYAIFGMMLVNLLGKFASMPDTLKHHKEYMSYALTIAPLFMFVVGMGFRLSMLRGAEQKGRWRALLSGARRYAVLTLIGIVLIEDPLNWSRWWDALVDIGFAGLLALPFVLSGGRIRVLAATGYLLAYQLLYTFAGYGAWTMRESLDGGPLGPLSWVFMLLMGTLAYDMIATGSFRRILLGCLGWGLLLSALGFLFRAQWFGVKEFWPFSQCAMSLPYTLYSTGLCFLMYIPFYLACDLGKIEIPTLTIVGSNPLVLYVLHGMYLDIHKTIVAPNSGFFKASAAFAGFYLIFYAIARYLYRNKIFIKL